MGRRHPRPTASVFNAGLNDRLGRSRQCQDQAPRTFLASFDDRFLMLFQSALLVAAVLCALVAGFLFAFAAVVMPGLRSLDDPSFIRSFQVVDRVVQNNQPLFGLVWVGSVLAVVVAAVIGVWALSGVDRLLMIVGALVYLLGVQLPTVVVNLPLNNQLQRLDVF